MKTVKRFLVLILVVLSFNSFSFGAYICNTLYENTVFNILALFRQGYIDQYTYNALIWQAVDNFNECARAIPAP